MSSSPSSSSSREPLWFCHQCHAEMRPLMTPDPTCASCRGSFVEKLENPADDPRNFQHRTANLSDNIPGTFDDFPHSDSWSATEDLHSSFHRPHSPPTQRNTSPSSGLRFEFHNGPDGGSTRTYIFGSSNTLRRSPSPTEQSVSTMLEFLRRSIEPPAHPRPNREITGPLMAQYLLALFGREHNRGQGEALAELLGMPPSARWGDYVFNQEALDQIMSQLAENATAGRPVPATKEIINDLPREVLTEGSPLLARDCAVCKESFKLDPEDPDDLIIVTLPCKHPFHEGCILPWLKSSGTCPVCRFALNNQAPPSPQQPPGGPSGGGPSSNRTNRSSGSRQNTSENSDRGGAGNLFHAIFRGGPSTSSGNGNTPSTRSRRNLERSSRDTRPEVISHSTPSVPGQWIEDID